MKCGTALTETGAAENIIHPVFDSSCQRMSLDYVDIFIITEWDPATPLEESMMALDTAVKQGKALYAGISNYDAKTTKRQWRF